MACFAPGTVVVYEQGAPSAPGQLPQRVIATVAGGPWQDGTYDLDCQRQVRPEALWRLSTGDCLEYLSASLGQWIPARVLRPGRAPGTLDLDVKEAVGSARLRPPGAAAPMPSGPAPAATLLLAAGGPSSMPPLPKPTPQTPPAGIGGAVAHELPAGRGGGAPAGPPRCPSLAGGWGPLGLVAGEDCFYRSSSHGWIPGRVLGWRAEEQTYDLDVKKFVRPDLIRCIREGDPVEYQSASAHSWIPARVLRTGKEPGLYDIDVKSGVSIKRLRPAEAGPASAPAAGGDASAPPTPACGSSSPRTPPPCYDGSFTRRGPAPLGTFDFSAALCGQSVCLTAWPGASVGVPQGAPGAPGDPVGANIAGATPGPVPVGTPPGGAGSPEPWPRPSVAAPAGGPEAALVPDSHASLAGSSSHQSFNDISEQQSFRITEQPAQDLPATDGELDANGHSACTAAVPTAKKLEQLREALQAQDADALRRSLESQSIVLLQGEQDLEHASHMLWALEARPAALRELRLAAAGSNPAALEAAIEAAAAAGAAQSDLEAGGLALQGMQAMAWVYAPEDGKHMDIRAGPNITGPRTKHVLHPGDVFRTSVEAKGACGVIYLKLVDGRGWVFHRKPGVGVLCYRHQDDSPGTYIITHDGVAVTPTVAIGRDQDVMDRIAFGEAVEVVETVYSEERIRGRLLQPAGWISLMNMETGKRWAEKRRG